VLEVAGLCVEIGPGTGIVTQTLRDQGIDVTTIDLDPRLGVNRVGSATALPCEDKEFDVALCAEVLEHLPWEDFPAALAEMARVARQRVVLSLPQSGRGLRFHVECTPYRPLALLVRTPGYKRWRFNGEHYWQIGAVGTGRRKVRREIERHFTIEREYMPAANLGHRFFVLTPRDSPR
jgi:hypothetical protein